MPRAMMLAFTSPTAEEHEDAYNDWYTNKHIHDLLKVDGLVSATRYELPKGIETLPGVPDAVGQRYMALYELEAESEEDLQRFADALKAALADGTADIHPQLDMENIAATFCLPISERVSNEGAAERAEA